MKRIKSWLRGLGLALLVTLMVVACGGEQSGDRPLSIGSKDFTEQFILGQLYGLFLEKQGIPVTLKLNLGGTPVAHEALKTGDIDLYPEYTGTALLTVLKEPSASDPQQVYNTVKTGYETQFQLTWLDPAPLNNTYAFAMERDRAESLGMQTISDLVDRAAEVVMIGPPEFMVREDGLPGLKEVYGDFDLKNYVAVDPGLRYQGLTAGEADVVVGFGTDGEISAYDLVVLEDDRQFFPPYQVAPVVRQDALDRFPTLADSLNQLSPLLTNEVMQSLNNEVSGKQRDPEAVALEFLQQSGLLN